MTFTEKNQAALEFELRWKSAHGIHLERRLLPRADLWRDVVHPALKERLTGAGGEDSFAFDFPAGSIVPPYREDEVIAVPGGKVRLPPPRCGEILRLGRFYPRGFLAGAAAFVSEDLRPFRVTGFDGSWVIADCNHPLARFPLSLGVRVAGVRERGGMLGGSCRDWLEEVTADGPGMQARWKDRATDFGGEEGLRRESEEDDGEFYRRPRLVDHIDTRASSFLEKEYARAIPPGSRVLDLMSSMSSHLPGDRDLSVTGLGLNLSELEHNPALDERIVHDLNRDTMIPFGDDSFAAVVCSLSFEYLVRPAEVVAEVRRVLAPGGSFLIGLSNRWFPPKVTRVWTEIHEFERMGFVSEHLLQEGSFTDLRTLSVRNWPRPADDEHYPGVRISDPVYVVSVSY